MVAMGELLHVHPASRMKPLRGILHARSRARNGDLVQDVVTAAYIGARRCRWPAGVPAKDAGHIMWQYTRDEVKYIAERGDQYIRLPWRTLEDGRGDCKSTAVLIASMCAAAGRRAVLRFVSYPGEDYYSHVYPVVDGTPCDPLRDYGTEYIYSHRLDVPVPRR